MPPASTVPTVCAAARRRDQCAATVRSGWSTGFTVPRSGQVPTTTSAPAARSAVTARDRSRTDEAIGTRCVTSLVPMIITATSTGRFSACATCTSRSAERAPLRATTSRSTRRRRSRAMPPASSAPGVCSARSQPRPAAAESPSTTRCTGLSPRRPRPYDPAARGACSVGSPMVLRASLASVASTANATPRAVPKPPPPYAALTAT